MTVCLRSDHLIHFSQDNHLNCNRRAFPFSYVANFTNLLSGAQPYAPDSVM